MLRTITKIAAEVPPADEPAAATVLSAGTALLSMEFSLCGTQTLKINSDKRDIESFSFDDFTLEGYNPHKKIAMQMAV